jgi:hypothetical protein
VSDLPGVRQAHATLRGTVDEPALDMRVTTQDPAQVGAVLNQLCDRAFPDFRRALGLERLPTLVRLRFAGGRAPRQVH